MSVKKALDSAATQMTDVSPQTVSGVRTVPESEISPREIQREVAHVRRSIESKRKTND